MGGTLGEATENSIVFLAEFDVLKLLWVDVIEMYALTLRDE